jgi:surfactin synthase thioesterase subunit
LGRLYTLDEAPVVRDVGRQVGGLTEDEAALVRTLTPARLSEPDMVAHQAELVAVLAVIRADEALADYVYAIAPEWDGSIEALLVGGRVTTAFARYELERVA